MTEKEQRLADFCALHGFDGALLRRRSNIAWLTDGADIHVDLGSALGIAALLWTPRRRLVLTDTIESPRLAAEEFTADRGLNGWEIIDHPWWDPEPDLPRGRWATDFPSDPFTDLRAPLTPLEIERARALGADAARIMGLVMQGVDRGDSEQSVAADLVGRLRREGLVTPVVLVAADERIARFRHPIPTTTKVDHTLMAAICAQRHGLTVSITRLVHLGKDLPADLRRRHDAVCAVDAALHAATIPGRRWSEAFADARHAYAAAGFPDEWRHHHQGGPMGYELRDYKATPTEAREIQPSQLVGWNPSIAGTKSEDTILTTAGGPPEVITPMPDWPVNARGPGAPRPDILLK